MEKSKVYFTNFRTIAFGDGLPTKLKKMVKNTETTIKQAIRSKIHLLN